MPFGSPIPFGAPRAYGTRIYTPPPIDSGPPASPYAATRLPSGLAAPNAATRLPGGSAAIYAAVVVRRG